MASIMTSIKKSNWVCHSLIFTGIHWDWMGKAGMGTTRNNLGSILASFECQATGMKSKHFREQTPLIWNSDRDPTISDRS